MGELETLMSILDKLQDVEKLKTKVENLEKKIEELSNIITKQKAEELNHIKSASTKDDRLKRASELAIAHWYQHPPRGASK